MAVGLKNFRILIKRWGLNSYYNAQGRNQNFFRAGEVLWNQDTLINISLKETKEKRSRRQKLGVSSPRYSYNYTLDRKINSKMDKIRAFFWFSKRAGEASPSPPSSCMPDAGGCWEEWYSIFLEKPFFLRNWMFVKMAYISLLLST